MTPAEKAGSRAAGENGRYLEIFFGSTGNPQGVLLQLVQSAPAAIIMTDQQDIIRVFNPAAESLLGYRAEELVGRSTPIVFHDANEIRAGLEAQGVAATGTPADFSKARELLAPNFPSSMEWTYIHKSGRRIPVLLQLDAIRDASGGTIGHVAYASDLTVLRQAQSDTAASIRRLEKIAAQVPGMVYQYQLDPDGSTWFPYVSEGCRSIFGIPPMQAAQTDNLLQSMLHPDEVEPLRRSVQDSAANLSPWNQEFRMCIPERGERWFACNSVPERLANGGTLWHGFLTDVTERKEFETELIAHNEILRILADTASDFIHLPLEEVEPAIQHALEDVAQRVDADRAYIFDYDFSRRVSNNTFEWCAPGITPQIANLRDLPFAGTEWAIELHRRGEPFIEENVPGLPVGGLRDLLVPQGIKSIVTIPLMHQLHCEGFIGFDFVRRHHRFRPREINLLLFFSKMLSGVRMRRAAQGALERSEQRLREMTDAAGEYVWEVDAAGRYVYVSERAEEVLGRPVGRILGRTPFDFMPREDAQRVRQYFRASLGKGEPFNGLRHRSLRPDGSIIHQVVNGRPFFSPEGTLLGYRGLGLDVTREEQARIELDRARQELEVFFDSAVNLLAIADLDGRFRRVSNSWANLLGLPRDKIEGAKFMEFIHPEDLDGSMREFERLLRNQQVTGFVNRYRRADGSYRHIEWNARGVNSLVYSVAQDVSGKVEEQRALHASLQSEREAAEIKGRLISMASHEFRTPLATIQMAAEMLETYWPRMDRQSIAQRLHLIAATTGELTRIIAEVLDYSILEAGTSGEAPRAMDIVAASRTLAENLVAQHGKDHRLRFSSQRESAEMQLKFGLYRQVLGNLLENALKYSPPGSEVALSLTWDRRGSRVRIEVRDHGMGIPAAARDKIWEPFFRAKNTGTVRGTGLGLAIARQAVAAMGGRIGCKPAGKSGGSLFHFTLPARAHTVRTAGKDPKSKQP